MTKRRTIGENPLDTVVSAPGAVLQEKPKRRAAEPGQVQLLERLAKTLGDLIQLLEKLQAQRAELRNLETEVDRLRAEMNELRQAVGPKCLCLGLIDWLRTKLAW
jgi:DNA repair exonuclease SbcCD ATPase subunit